MSLLLDALKKAADDKKKHSSAEQTSKEISAAQNNSNSDKPVDNSLDLELHINDEDNSPELDESALNDFQTHEEPELDIDETAEEYPATDDLSNESALDDAAHVVATTGEENAVNKPDSPPIIEKADPVTEPAVTEVSAQISPEITPETPAESISTESVPSTETDVSSQTRSKPGKEALTLQPTSTPETSAHNINNEHALSALINKSNHHSRKQKRKQLIIIVSLIALIFTGSGLYFYIQLKTSNQHNYTAQTKQTSINRKPVLPEPVNKPPVVIPQVKQTPVIEKLPISNARATLPSATLTRKQTLSTKSDIKPPDTKPVLSIVRTKKPDPVHSLLSSAYTEFNKTNYPEAEKLYLQVLLRESKNRDALLGIAAIAIKQSRYEVARQKYQYLLKLNPRDSLATAGLSSIKNISNPQLNVSQLKFMINQQPDTPHLYFALGSLYSSQNKWPEAQSAFFSAWSADNKNADYAYNLAVSLDHMNHPAQALNYYQLSLKLMSGSNSNFSVLNTQKRISLLQGSIQ